jgi:Tfp pilus assembly protein PilF
MKRTALFLFLLALDFCGAQALPAPFPPTPAQSDWADGQQDFVVDPRLGNRAPALTISSAQLRHRPPRKAVNAFLRGVKYTAAHDWTKSQQEFKKAVEADPEFSEAHGDLGAVYSYLHSYEDASTEFRRAIELDPSTGVYHSNLAFVLIQLDQPAEAEREAQTAVSLIPDNLVAHYILGCLLARNPATESVGERHLIYAARQIPDAHLVLAQLYNSRGATELGAAEMERYRQATANWPGAQSQPGTQE